MTALPECPELECWQALFDEAVPAEQRDRFERHLESCPACQAALDRVGDGGDALLPLLRQVGDTSAEAADPALRHVVERLHEAVTAVRPSCAEPADLYFLRPLGQPGVLGTLGGYEVLEVVGQGGMGVVLKAYEPALNRYVAVKVLAAAVAGSATARLRFTREARAAAAVCHDHVVPVYGVHEADGLPYLVMQYVAGESLQDRLDRAGPLEVEEVVRIGHQTASGLAAAHAQGLIHRDIKPANLLLENGVARVKITDFGLARMADDVGLTRDGVVAGTPEYMAPEQARGEPVDHRADLFSLGSVLYAMCTGVSPFHGAAPLAVLRQVSEQTPPPVRQRNPDVPAWLEGLIARLLARAPAERFQSAAEVAALLEGYLAHLRQPALVAAPRLPPDPGQRQRAPGRADRPRRSWLGAVAALALLAAGGASFEAWRWAAPPPPKPRPAEAAEPPPLRAEYPAEFHPALKGSGGDIPGLVLYGPNAADCVKFEPDGLHITLPANFPRDRPGTGVVTDFGVRGDFEITVGFEILGGPRPSAWGNPTELRLWVVPNEVPQPGKWHKANQNYASLSRQAPRPSRAFPPDGGMKMKPKVVQVARWDGPGSFRDCTRWNNDNIPRDEWGNEQFNDIEEHRDKTGPAAANTGRLRMVRQGPTLYFFTSEPPADGFNLLFTKEFGTEDLKNVRVFASTGAPGASFDVRVTDLSIRAEGLPTAPAASTPPAAAGAGPKGPLALLGLAGLVVAVAASLGAWQYVRTRRRPAAAKQDPVPALAEDPMIVFKCPGCGKRLRARAAQAGSKPKCPQCGKEVVVPSVSPKKPEEQP